MIKLGVTTLPGLRAPRTWLGREKHVSLLLLAEPALSSAAATGHHEQIVKRVLLADHTWRETAVGRLSVLDRCVVDRLRQSRPAGTRLRVFDLAASTGCTSVELYSALRESFAVDFIASDRTRDVFAVRAHGSHLITVVDPRQGDVLQYVYGPFVLPGQGRESSVYPFNHFARLLCRRLRSSQLGALVTRAAARQCTPFTWTTIGTHDVMQLPLLSGACLSLLKDDPHFRYDVADILQPLDGTADVIRAMNILHTQYFTLADLRTALRNCLAALAEGGMLVIGRSPTDDPAAVTATVFTKQSAGVEAVARLNGGSEIEPLVHESLA